MSGLYCPLQSAYRRHHSTETALLKISNDIFEAVNSGNTTVLVALDLSAAFDTIDHSVLINRREYTLGLGGLALEWVKSYLGGQTSFVKIGGERSATTGVVTGVPQGPSLDQYFFHFMFRHSAILSPSRASNSTNMLMTFNFTLLSMSTMPLMRLRIYLSVRLIFMTGCYTIASHSTRTSRNLQCSSSKMIAVSKLLSPTVSGAPIAISKHIKNLRVTLDGKLSFDKHVDNVCRDCHFHIRALRHVRSAMSRETANMVACVIVSSRHDYCNSVLAGMSSANLDRLQRVQNTLARVVTGTQRRDHITPVLAGLHWLPVQARITFKVTTMVYKIRETRQPTYLSKLITDYYLRSSSANRLAVHTCHSSTGARSYIYLYSS